MKTSHFSENYDLCHPLLGCENSNNNSNISSNIANSYSHHQQNSTKHSSAIVTYGNSSGDQTTKFEKNANDFQIKQQLKQQQQEQNKKRKRETADAGCDCGCVDSQTIISTTSTLNSSQTQQTSSNTMGAPSNGSKTAHSKVD
jgi:hypothetical protein